MEEELMTADERLALINVKIEQAKKHLVGLRKDIVAFNKANPPYKVGTKRDPQTRKLIYYVAAVPAMPHDFAAAAGDIIQNLRSALDHLAYQLFLVGTNGTGDHKRIHFPFADVTTQEGMKNFEGKVEGMRKDAKDALLCVEAYKGGRGHVLWQINRLNRTDKHRLLITVNACFQSFDVGALVSNKMQQAFGRPVHPLPLFLRPAHRPPLKEGDELFIDAPDAEPNENMEFRFDIALSEPEVIDGKPLIETLQSFTDIVSSTVLDFKPCLEDIGINSAISGKGTS